MASPFLLMLILLTSVTLWFFKLNFISSSVNSDNSECFITPLDEFKDWWWVLILMMLKVSHFRISFTCVFFFNFN